MSPTDDDAPLSGDAITEVPEPTLEMLRAPFDPVLSDPVRLRLQAALCGLPPSGSMTFTALRRTLQLSDGNLGAHLAILVDREYVAAEATYRGRRRTLRYATTVTGRAAFETHTRALRAVIEAAGPGPQQQAPAPTDGTGSGSDAH